MRKHNFNAGPAILPASALQAASNAVLELDGIGMSILEVSHRSKEFEAILDEAKKLLREILSIPNDYHILFLQGGASTQFAMVPYNLLEDDKKAAYLETGHWAKKANEEAMMFGNVEIVASSADKNFTYVPKNYTIPKDAVYFHITSNNTIYGTQMHNFPQSPVPLAADMSSDFLSRRIDVPKFSLIYAGAQKNFGPAGVTLVIIKDSMLGKVKRKIPTMLNYKTHTENNSMYNTPPCFAIFAALHTLKWIKSTGGVSVIEKSNDEKAKRLYDEIDRNPLFKGTCVKEDRSKMNVTFVMQKPELEPEFLKTSEKAGMVGLKGHRSVGGFRASIYNALPIESVDALVGLMREFAVKHA